MVQKIQQLCLLLEFHQFGSVINGANMSIFVGYGKCFNLTFNSDFYLYRNNLLLHAFRRSSYFYPLFPLSIPYFRKI